MRLSRQFHFFYEKFLSLNKTRQKQNPTNKTKLNKQKTTKATIFRACKNF